MAKQKRYSPEVRERAIRIIYEQEPAHSSQWAAIFSIGDKIGRTPETLRRWKQQAERDAGRRSGLTTNEREKVQRLKREYKELKRGERDSAQSVSFFRPGGARPQTEVMVYFVDEHRDVHGVESICKALPIAPSTYYEHRARKQDPSKRPTPGVDPNPLSNTGRFGRCS